MVHPGRAQPGDQGLRVETLRRDGLVQRHGQPGRVGFRPHRRGIGLREGAGIGQQRHALSAVPLPVANEAARQIHLRRVDLERIAVAASARFIDEILPGGDLDHQRHLQFGHLGHGGLRHRRAQRADHHRHMILAHQLIHAGRATRRLAAIIHEHRVEPGAEHATGLVHHAERRFNALVLGQRAIRIRAGFRRGDADAHRVGGPAREGKGEGGGEQQGSGQGARHRQILTDTVLPDDHAPPAASRRCYFSSSASSTTPAR